MEKVIEKISDNWHKNSGASIQDISTLESNLNIVFQNDYKSFIQWSNGGEGEIGVNYISLWKIEDIVALNDDYQIQKYLTKDYLLLVQMEEGYVMVSILKRAFLFLNVHLEI